MSDICPTCGIDQLDYDSMARKAAAKLAQTAKPSPTDREREATVVALEAAALKAKSFGVNDSLVDAIRAIYDKDLAAARAEMRAAILEEAAQICIQESRDVCESIEGSRMGSLITQSCEECAKAIRKLAANSRPAKPTPGRDGEL